VIPYRPDRGLRSVRSSVLLAVLALVLCGTRAPAQAPATPAEFAAKVDEYVGPLLKMGDFSGTILVARGGQTLVSRGYGTADLEASISPTPATPFAVGSISKTFTAAAILLLAQQGRLRLTDPVSRFLPRFAHGDSITITQLLEHSSGLSDYYSWPAYATGRMEAISQAAFLDQAQRAPLDFPPGSRSSYSNTGYFVLATIVEKASGTSYADFLARNLFRPLAMKRSGVMRDGDMPPEMAFGYDPTFPPERLALAAPVSWTWMFGNGSVYSSAEDLYRWLEAVRHRTPVNLRMLSYPFGWGKRTRFGREMLEQNGRIPTGYTSYVGLYPAEDLEIVVLSNVQADVTERMGVDLAAMALGESYSQPELRLLVTEVPDPADLAAYEGRYEIAPGFALSVRAVSRGLQLAGPDGAFLPLDWEGEDRFFFRPLYVPVTFQRNGAGAVSALVWNGETTANRVEPR